MTDTINISRIQTNKKSNLTTLYNDTKYTENEMYNDSPLSLNTSECKYFISVKLPKYVKSETVSLLMFYVICHSLEAHWDTLQEVT